jgi:molybdopterin-binding protein
MRISARNQLKGKIVDIKEGAVNAKVVIQTNGGEKLTSIVTMDSLKELNLKTGSDVYAVIKSSSVMIATD